MRARWELLLDGLRFPEGPCWSARDGGLYFVEWEGERIWRWRDGRAEVFFAATPGDGPCGLAQDAAGNLWACMYSTPRLVQLDQRGELLRQVDRFRGRPFRGLNDLVVDAGGGLYFTDSGDFEDDWRSGQPAGALYYLPAGGTVQQVDAGLCYPNGLALAADGATLFVCEHRRNCLLCYDVAVDGGLGGRRLFFALDDDCRLPSDLCYGLGPDGMTRDDRGRLWVAHHGGGKLVGVNPDGSLAARLPLPRGVSPTNVAFDPAARAFYVTESECGLLYRLELDE